MSALMISRTKILQLEMRCARIVVKKKYLYVWQIVKDNCICIIMQRKLMHRKENEMCKTIITNGSTISNLNEKW